MIGIEFLSLFFVLVTTIVCDFLSTFAYFGFSSIDYLVYLANLFFRCSAHVFKCEMCIFYIFALVLI